MRAKDSDVKNRLTALLRLPAFGGRVQLRMNSKLYYIALGLALSAVWWGIMILVLMPLAFGSEFGSSTMTNSTYTSVIDSNSAQTQICDKSRGPCGGGEGTSLPISYPEGSSYVNAQSTRTVSDYTQLGIILSIVLVSVLAAIAYFRRKK